MKGTKVIQLKKMIRMYILFYLLILISGCSLAMTNPNENNYDDEHQSLIGVWVNLMDDGSTFETATSLKLFEKRYFIYDHLVSEIHGLPGFCNVNINNSTIDDDGKKITSTTYEVDIIFNRSFKKIILIHGIYEKDEEIYYNLEQITTIDGLDLIYKFSQKRTVNGNSEERSVTVNVNYVDTLKFLSIDKYDQDSNLIASETITTDEDKTIEINNEVEYIIISEYFTDKNGDYIKRSIINHNEFEKPFLLKFTNDKGFVSGNTLNFKRVDSL